MVGQLDGVPGQAEDGAQRPDYDAGEEQGDRSPRLPDVEYVFEDALADLELDVCDTSPSGATLSRRRLEARGKQLRTAEARQVGQPTRRQSPTATVPGSSTSQYRPKVAPTPSSDSRRPR